MKYLKIYLLVLLLPAVVFGSDSGSKDWRKAEGRVFIVRHGQRAPIRITDLDPPLTLIGRKQAELAGQYLRRLKFKGRIIASPYRRTLETASLIAKHTGGRILVCPEIQEFVRGKGKPGIKQRSLTELKKEFPLLAEESVLDLPWAVSGPETLFTLADRIDRALCGIAYPAPDSDVLLVSHGELQKSLDILMKDIKGPEIPKWKSVNWNCAISEYKLRKNAAPVCVRLFDVSFLPDELVTSNAKKRLAENR
ncbi:MAG: histidine phosphatase family protein [Lentisphaeria bacterium]|nr:histidine phosphatase family protein [Lentisphaeria bacterium]